MGAAEAKTEAMQAAVIKADAEVATVPAPLSAADQLARMMSFQGVTNTRFLEKTEFVNALIAAAEKEAATDVTPNVGETDVQLPKASNAREEAPQVATVAASKDAGAAQAGSDEGSPISTPAAEQLARMMAFQGVTNTRFLEKSEFVNALIAAAEAEATMAGAL